jgi:pyrroline-5-carboxylate reductase
MELSQPPQKINQNPCKQLGIIGGGVMAEAILSRVLAQHVYRPDAIIISDISQARLDYLGTTYRVETTTENSTVVQQAATVLLAIKPQVFPAIAAELSQTQLDCELWLSILAGTPLSQLESAFGPVPIIRAMPNTPALVGAGITALAPGTYVQPHHLNAAEKLFAAVGEVLAVSESWMDAITGLSGSGPAFVAVAIEALTDGGVAVGLPRVIAARLALQTVRGTAELMAQNDLHPALLKDQVTSPGGTTIAGIASLEAAGFRSALIQAVQAAYQRALTLRA